MSAAKPTTSILDDLRYLQEQLERHAVKPVWDKHYTHPFYYPTGYPTVTAPCTQPNKETPVIKTEIKTVTVKSFAPYVLEQHSDGKFVLKGLYDPAAGKAIEPVIYGREQLKQLYKLLHEVVVG